MSVNNSHFSCRFQYIYIYSLILGVNAAIQAGKIVTHRRAGRFCVFYGSVHCCAYMRLIECEQAAMGDNKLAVAALPAG